MLPANRPPFAHACLAILATLLLAACGQLPAGYSAGAGPFPPIGGSATGGVDPSWWVCQGGNPSADYNCPQR